jgi:uncharacterized membrane protein
MTLQWIAIILGLLATASGIYGLLRTESVQQALMRFPRSTVPAWILAALCCLLGAREALHMNMGFLNAYKSWIYLLAPAVFAASVVYLNELLAPRALGGFLLLIAVPILQIARWHDAPMRLVVVVLVYFWIVLGLLLLLSPWWLRRLTQPLSSLARIRMACTAKTLFGLFLLLLGFFFY